RVLGIHPDRSLRDGGWRNLGSPADRVRPRDPGASWLPDVPSHDHRGVEDSCAVVLLIPRFPGLKEWAYAGAFFNYTGAAACPLFVGDGASKWVAPLVFAGFTIASWALRSPARRLVGANPSIDRRAVTWLVPILIFVVMLILSFVTLPKGPPPS